VHLIWWSRVGVATGALGGLIIVLDIVGESKLEQYGLFAFRKWFGDGDEPVWEEALDILITVVPFFVTAFYLHARYKAWRDLTMVALVVLGFLIVVFPVMFIFELVLRLLKSGKVMTVARIFALLMLLASAHFTLLTS
jgi:phosphoglycerol transferase MdoB-like AlkP superfamily enzyme